MHWLGSVVLHLHPGEDGPAGEEGGSHQGGGGEGGGAAPTTVDQISTLLVPDK